MTYKEELMSAQNWRRVASVVRHRAKVEHQARIRTDEQFVVLGARMLRHFLERSAGAAARDLLRSTGKTINLDVFGVDQNRPLYDQYLFTGAGIVVERRELGWEPGEQPYSRTRVKPEEFEKLMRVFQKSRQNPKAPVYVVQALASELDKIASEVPV